MLTIGIPVYNEEKYIEKTLKSVVENINYIEEVIVTDNASTDGTERICKFFSEKYPKIKYVRHEENIGIVNNWRFVLREAKTPYFMWLGAHDRLSKGYVEIMLKKIKLLEGNYVLIYPKVKNINYDEKVLSFDEYPHWEKLCCDASLERIYNYIKLNAAMSGYLQGIFKTGVLIKSFCDDILIGLDHLIIIRALSQGKIAHELNAEYIRMHPHKEEDTIKGAFKRYKTRGYYKSSSEWERYERPYKPMQLKIVEIVKKMQSNNKKKWIAFIKTQLRKYGDYESSLDPVTYAKQQIEMINVKLQEISNQQTLVVYGDSFHTE